MRVSWGAGRMSQVLLVALISSKKKESSSLLEGRELRSFEEKEGVKCSFWRVGKAPWARGVGFLGRLRVHLRRGIKSFKCRGQFTTKLIQFMLQDPLACTDSWGVAASKCVHMAMCFYKIGKSKIFQL